MLPIASAAVEENLTTACAHVFVGAEGNRGHGSRLVGPEAGQEAQRAG